MPATLHRTPFTTSRALEFFSERELTAQTGLPPRDWPLMIAKELADNGLDACEAAGTPPQLRIMCHEDRLEVADNGPGLPRETLERQFDFQTRTSTNSKYVSPTRGQQGNAAKTILAAPFVQDPEQGQVDVATPDYSVSIRLRIDPLLQEPRIEAEWGPGTVNAGTLWRVGWPGLSSPRVEGQLAEFLPALAALNPHLTLAGDEGVLFPATEPAFRKWLPSQPTSPHWYDRDDLGGLVAAHLAAGNDRPLRELVREFAGLSSTVKAKQVLEACGLSGARLSGLLQGEALDAERMAGLLNEMQQASPPLKPERLGVLSREHLSAALIGLGGEPETFRYKRIAGNDDGLGFVVTAAFAWRPDAEERQLITGVNWTPTYRDPFQALGASGEPLSELLGDRYCGWDEPIVLVVHLTHPKPRFTDRGKTSLTLRGAAGDAVRTAVLSVIKEWEQQRRREDREAQARLRRREKLSRQSTRRIEWLQAMREVMPEAYQRTAGTTGIAEARQLMYASRPRLQDLTGQPLDDKYFSYQLLPRFQREHPELTADWNVVYDQRGHLVEPHTQTKVPLSTLGVRHYLGGVSDQLPVLETVAPVLSTSIPTAGPLGRYQAILFSEKEGMLPILERAGIPERFDVALMTTKGNTVTAARELVDELTLRLAALDRELPIIVLHDFDVTGLTILSTFRKDTDRYTYKTGLRVIDAGLRLEQALEMQLQDETVMFPRKKAGGHKSPLPETLRENSASDEEIAYLLGDGRQGRRVELNAMSSDQFVTLVETTLINHGLGQKVVPDEAELQQAYRSMRAVHTLNAATERLAVELRSSPESVEVPTNLSAQLQELLRRNPRLPWDRALSELAGRDVDSVRVGSGKTSRKSSSARRRVI